MQNTSINGCNNCLERGKICDGADPICNLCIRDGLFCSGSELPIRAFSPTPLPWEPPGPVTTLNRTLNADTGLLRGTISTIVLTPSWGNSNHSENSSNDSSRHSPPLTSCPSAPRTLPLDPRVTSNTSPFVLGQCKPYAPKLSNFYSIAEGNLRPWIGLKSERLDGCPLPLPSI
ncbi:hypothetical protein RSAG8_06700, partial [Rhizoctonia solani AG-8 WAC10335]